MTRLRHRRGFTLLEMILAMMMVSILSAGLYYSLTTAFRARERADATVTPVRAASIAGQMLLRDLESVPPIKVDGLNPAFLGFDDGSAGAERDSIEFYCVGADDDAWHGSLSEGMRRVELLVQSEGSTLMLVRRITRNLRPVLQDDAQEEIICRGVKSFSLTYFDGASWASGWDSAVMGDVLPLAVRMDLELEIPAPGNRPSPPISHRLTRIIPLACGTVPADAAGGAQ